MSVVQIGTSRITVVPVIRGLLSERDKVREMVMGAIPQAIAVSISKEELAGLKNMDEDLEYDMSEVETLYSDVLSGFGEVALPPPCFSVALEMSEKLAVPILPIDMNEELYSATYCTTVGTLDLIRESLFLKRLRKRLMRCASPDEFVITWDSLINRSKGFSLLAAEREEHMAGVLKRLSRKYSEVVAIIELERVEGVLSHLEGNSSEKG
jgi:pheromone shutdown protein TraB